MRQGAQSRDAAEGRRQFHTLKELAEITTRDYRTIHRATRAGKIRTIRFGGSVMIPREEFERILQHGWR